MNYQDYKQNLIEIHNKLKEHPFRKNFMDKTLEGTWKAQLKEYRNLLYESTNVICDIIYRCKDGPLKREDGEWIHNFRHLLLAIDYFYLGKLRDSYIHTKIKDFHLTPYEVMSTTGITDIATLMIFFEKYISYIHMLIETDSLEKICGVEYERCTEPHNGYYYEHLIDYEKIDGEWKIVTEPKWIGTIKK